MVKAEKKTIKMINSGSFLINNLPESVRERRPAHLLWSPPSGLWKGVRFIQ